MIHDEEEILTPLQAAKLLGITRTTLWRWATAGKIPYFIINTQGHKRFKRNDVENMRVYMNEEQVQNDASRAKKAISDIKTRIEQQIRQKGGEIHG